MNKDEARRALGRRMADADYRIERSAEKEKGAEAQGSEEAVR